MTLETPATLQKVTATRWPWQRKLQYRLMLAYGLIFLVALALLTLITQQIVYRTYLSDAEHDLEVKAFLAANALEDPLSGFAQEFEKYESEEDESEDDESEDDESEEDQTPPQFDLQEIDDFNQTAIIEQFNGYIEKMPNDEFIGEWVIDEKIFFATIATSFKQKRGALAVGRCVEVQYINSFNEFILLDMRTHDNYFCDDTIDEGIIEVVGYVEELPMGGLLGGWTVNDTTYLATERTSFDQDNGRLNIGSCVYIQFLIETSPPEAYEIETGLFTDCQEPTQLATTEQEQAETISRRLQQVALTYADDAETRVTFLSASGKPLADSIYPIEQIPNQLDQVEIQAALNASEQHNVRIDPLSGQTHVFAAAPVRQGGHILGFVQISKSLDEVTKQGRNLLYTMGFSSLVALLLTTILSYWISRYLVRPIQQLEHTAIAIADGDLDQRTTVERSDEVGSLAHAFNYMVDQLERLFKQQRLFVASASHELRTPVTNIKLRSEMILDFGESDPAFVKRYLTEIDSEADRLGRLAHALLDLSRLESTPKSSVQAPPVDVRPKLAAIDEMIRLRSSQSGIDFSTDISASPINLAIPLEDIEAILVNLLDNAIKYTPEGGRIQLATHIGEKTCQIHVQDTGMGIPEEDLPYIFDRFYRVDKARSRREGLESEVGSGTGLGLAITKALVEQNNGNIWAESTLGEGSIFIVEFPWPAQDL